MLLHYQSNLLGKDLNNNFAQIFNAHGHVLTITKYYGN